jgi:hypothetical protein
VSVLGFRVVGRWVDKRGYILLAGILMDKTRVRTLRISTTDDEGKMPQSVSTNRTLRCVKPFYCTCIFKHVYYDGCDQQTDLPRWDKHSLIIATRKVAFREYPQNWEW